MVSLTSPSRLLHLVVNLDHTVREPLHGLQAEWHVPMSPSDLEARSLFASLVESHEINRTSPAEYGNDRRRERLMKTLFAANYARAARTAAAPPKVLLKFGAYHVYRGLNPVHGSGIGN